MTAGVITSSDPVSTVDKLAKAVSGVKGAVDVTRPRRLARHTGPRPAQVLRHASAPVSSGRLASVQLRPAVGIAAIQAVAVLAALPLLNVSTASAVPLALLTLLAAAVFTLVALVLRWFRGWLGVAAVVMLLIAQAAALGNVIPIETAPRLLQTLNGLMPLTAYVNTASPLVTGGHVGSLSCVMLVLLAWGLGSSVAAVLVVRRGRLTPARPASVSPAW